MSLPSGKHLGPYLILRPIGAGGMGEVYRANDPRLDRDVAVKVLADRESSSAAIELFRSEARAVAALSHPNILAAYDFGVEAGVAYVVTELLEGETLRELIDRGAVSWKQAAEMGASIADGLAAAHEKGITHRDIKPENVFITSDSRVKILDFGLARINPAFTAADEDQPTRPISPAPSGTVSGTINYMPPEQLRGQPADPRSDIFSLGCVLYELVTGRGPFARRSPVDTVAAILKEEPEDVMADGVRMPVDFARVIGRCLEKNPAQRFQSARDLAFALRGIGVSSTSIPVQRPRSGRLRYLPLAAIPLLLLAPLLMWQRSRTTPPQRVAAAERKPVDSIAVLPILNESRDTNLEYLSDGLTEGLINTLSQLPGIRVMSRNSVFNYKAVAPDAAKIGRTLGVRAILVGRLQQIGNRITVSSELVDTSDNSHLWGDRFITTDADLLTVQEQMAQKISAQLKVRLTEDQQRRLEKRPTTSDEAYQLYLRGRYEWNKRTGDGFRKAIVYFRQAIDLDPQYALAFAGLADCYALMSGYSESRPAGNYPTAKQAALEAIRLDDSLAEAHASLALITDDYDRDWVAAEAQFRRAIELNPGYATAHHWYALFLAEMGRFDEARAEIHRALEVDPLSLVINRNAGRIEYYARDYVRAAALLEKTLQMAPEFAPALFDYGLVLIQQQRFPAAVQSFEKASRVSGQSEDLAGVAYAYAVAGRADDAKRTREQLEKIEKTRYVSPWGLAMMYTGLGERDRAFATLQRAIDDRYPQIPFLAGDPAFDPLRSDPRFDELLIRAHLRKLPAK